MYQIRMLRDDNPENLGGGDGGDIGDAALEKIVNRPGAELEPEQVEGGEGGEQTPPKTVAKAAAKPVELTDERIAEIAARVQSRNSQQQQQRQEEPKLSAEEIEKLLNPVKVSREDVAEMLGIEDPTTLSDKRVAKFQAMLQAAVKNANSVTNVMLETRFRKAMEQVAPMEQFYRQQAAEQQKAAFYKRHENLAKYGRLVQAAASQVTPTPDMTAEQAMDAVASMAKTMLKEAGIDPDAAVEDEDNSGTATTHGADGSRSVPKMASLQKSGRGTGPAKTGGGNNPDADIYS